uniref:Oxidative stress-responsive serine-rich protein 1 n=1 Tax=Culex tarsalis TaxID=7177 RepID=A0A1Q3FJG6_CULTA
MSTDTEDANFDETLKNLELLSATVGASAGSDRPSGVPAVANPFQVPDMSAEQLLQRNESIVKQIFGARCECGAERGSGPVACHKGSTSAHKQHGSLEHGIINPTPFKHKVKGEKKVIVREAILKNIGKCVHQNLVKQNNLSKELVKQQQQRLSNTFLPAPSPLKPSRSENNLSKGFNQDAGDDILDFRLLVAQCSELTLSNGSKSADGPNFSRNSFKTLRQPEIFASGSSHSPVTFIGPSRRNRRARQLKRYNSTSSLESDSSSGGGNGGGSNAPAIGTSNSGSSSSNRTPPHHSSHPLQQSPNSSSSSPTASSSSSASCSTQARLNGSSMPCDITIDEMACYFETLVHIPKKMSSMAEMMYI